MELVFFYLLWLAVPAYVVLQILALVWARGMARFLAGAPLIVMVPVFAYTMNALAQDSNLWPLLLLFSSPVAMVYAGVATVVARRTQTPAAA